MRNTRYDVENSPTREAMRPRGTVLRFRKGEERAGSRQQQSAPRRQGSVTIYGQESVR